MLEFFPLRFDSKKKSLVLVLVYVFIHLCEHVHEFANKQIVITCHRRISVVDLHAFLWEHVNIYIYAQYKNMYKEKKN